MFRLCRYISVQGPRNKISRELWGSKLRVFAHECAVSALSIPGESKKFIRFVVCGIKVSRPIFKTEMLIFQSKAYLDGNILFGKSLII